MSAGRGPFAEVPQDHRTHAPATCPVCGAYEARELFHKHGWRFVRCTACTHVRLDPLPSPTLLAQVYDASYSGGLYARFAAATAVRAATAAARVAVIRPRVAPGPWLDVGCSTGALLEAATNVGLDAEGIDLSSEAVGIARAQGLSATCSTVETFVPGRQFSCVTAFDLIEHLLDPGSLLRRVGAWLQPEGRIILTVPDIGSAHARLMGRSWYFYAPPVHVHYFDRHTVTRLLRRHGFRVVHTAVAHKVLTLDYILETMPAFLPWLAAPSRLATRVLSSTIRGRPHRMTVGEILVIAERAADSES